MRLLLITHSYLPERTPPQRRWTAFVRSFREAGWDVDVVAPPPDAHHTPQASRASGGTSSSGPAGECIRRTWAAKGLPATRVGRFIGHVVHSVTAIPAALMTPRPDLLVVTVPALPSAVTGWAVSRLRRVPLIVEMRDAWPDLARESGVRAGLLSRMMEAVLTGVQQNADLVVTVTEGFAARLQERGVGQVATIGNGVELAEIHPVPPRTRPPGRLQVLYLGNHGESQGLETVIRAAALVQGSGVSVRLVGQGTQRDRLLELNRSLGCPVEMSGPVYGEQLQEQYAWADTCVVSLRPDWPSFAWTVPSKTYELLAVGRHITGLVTGEAARLLKDSGSADLAPHDPQALADLWRSLAADPDTTAVGASGRSWITDHADLPVLGRRFAQTAAQVARRTVASAGRGRVRLPGLRRRAD